MNPVIYQLKGLLPTGKYLPGQYRWPSARRITSALLTCRPPSVGTMTLEAEVNGALTGVTIAVPSSADDEVTLNESVNILVPANEFVRWLVTYDGAPETSGGNASLTMMAGVPGPAPVLTVRWVNGVERLTLYNYNPSTKTFTEASPGITAGRAQIFQNASLFTLTIQGDLMLRVQGGVTSAENYFAIGGVATVRSPRVAFMMDNVTLATVSADGLRVTDLTEADPLPVPTTNGDFFERFEFYNGGMLAAVIGAAGLTASAIAEATL